MNKTIGIKASKPVAALKKSLTLNSKEFSKALGKAGANIFIGKWDALTVNAVDLLSSLGLKSSVNEMAWLFLYRGFLRAIKQIVEEVLQIEVDSKDIKNIHDILASVLDGDKIILDKNFFNSPQNHALVHVVADKLRNWLESQGIKQQDSISTSNRLRSYIAASLHDEWASAPLEYSILKDKIDTPFTQASEREFSWLRYSAWLKKQIELPMFLEPFCLRQVYVPLRGYFNRVSTNINQSNASFDEHVHSKQVRVVIDLQSELESWIDKADKNDSIRLVSGGPGSGKSSFAKTFAAIQSDRLTFPVLFIPLHHFEPSDDLIDAIGKFIRLQNILSANPLDWEYGEPRILLIFDGLDELALQGRIGERTAQEFVVEVLRKTDQINQQKLKIQVIITGRELIIQTSETYFRKEGQILTVLPYYVADTEKQSISYLDPNGMLDVDLRQQWWANYAKVSGDVFEGLPEELNKGNLTEITSQPLLNYLVALALKRGHLKFSANTNLNAIYADLLRAIYERGWAAGQHVTIRGLEEHEFSRILEEIALASWHGDGRTTTVKEIEAHCASSGLQNLLDKFQHGMEGDPKARVTQLLTAFYFRQSGKDTSGERTFEFTHKSFGEYLTAKRLVRSLILIDRKLKQHDRDSDDGWSARESLHRWIEICGQTAIDGYVFNFLTGEIQLYGDEVIDWQKTLCRLIEVEIQYGMPVDRISPRTSHNNENRIARNSEESLLIILNACSRKTKICSKIKWPNTLSFGNMISRLIGQRDFNSLLLLRCLSNLDLQSCVLTNRDFWESDFSFSDLRNANLVGADCRYTNFKGADLRGARFIYGNFSGANFSGAQLGSPDKRARAKFANKSGAGLNRMVEKCYMRGVNFSNANLEGVNFSGIDMRLTNFSESYAKDAIFNGSILNEEQRLKLQELKANTENSIISSESGNQEYYMDDDDNDNDDDDDDFVFSA